MITVHQEARKYNLRGLEGAIPRVRDIVKDRGYLLIPLVFMIYLLFTRVTPTYSALGAIASSLMTYSLHWWAIIPVVVMAVLKETTNLHFTEYTLIGFGVWLAICAIRRRMGFHPYEILVGLRNGARGVLTVAIACGMAGMIVGTITLTGIGLKFASGLSNLAGGNIYLLMLFTMFSCLILGLGMPTTANYLITSTIAAPALIGALVMFNDLSAPTVAMIMGAHFFCFYFGIIADITPPVALVTMATSAIARSDPFRSMIKATQIAIAAFIVPFIFILNPAILLIDTNVVEVLQIVATALIGMYSLSGGLVGFLQDHCKWYERILLAASGIGMIYPGALSDAAGLAILVAIIVIQKMRTKKPKAIAA
jgi:TRAP transporter 4TM/12TM fusion protein